MDNWGFYAILVLEWFSRRVVVHCQCQQCTRLTPGWGELIEAKTLTHGRCTLRTFYIPVACSRKPGGVRSIMTTVNVCYYQRSHADSGIRNWDLLTVTDREPRQYTTDCGVILEYVIPIRGLMQ
jgi:hypothetical protein